MQVAALPWLCCFADIKHTSTLHRVLGEEISAVHLDTYPRHKKDKADTIETCETEAVGKRSQPKRSSLTYPDSGIVLIDVSTDWRRKCSSYNGS